MINPDCLRRRAVRLRAVPLGEPKAVRCGPFLWLLVPAVIGLSGRVQAAEPPSSGSVTSSPTSAASPLTANGGNQVFAAPTGSLDTSQPDAAYARPSPVGFAEGSYVPGFGGCATADVSGGGTFLEGESLRHPVVRPEAPANHQGRYVQLSLDAAEVYSDNLTLAPDDEAISDFVTDISPRLDACANAGRIRGNLEYRLQGLVYANHSHYSRVYNNVAGQTTIELLPRHLYLGADTRYGQAVVDPSFGYSRSNILRPDHNRTGQWTTNITPYYVQSLGPVGQGMLRYRYGKAIHSDSDVPDATINGVYLNIDSPPQQTPLSWHANAYTQKVHRSGGNPGRFFDHFRNDFNDVNNPYANDQSANTRHFDRATLELNYQLTYSIQLIANGGLEDDYNHGDNDRFGSTFYGGGFRWGSAENSLEFRVAHRFFGTSYFAQASHRGQSLDASVNYREGPSSQGLNTLNGNATSFNTSFSQPSTSLFDRGVFVEKRLQFSGAYHTAITRTTLQIYSQHRDYVEGSGSEEFNRRSDNEHYVGGNLRFDYQFQARTSILPEFGYFKNDADGGDSHTADAAVTLVRQVSPSLQAALGYGHAWRRGDFSDRDYDENRVTLQFSKGF